MIGLTSYPAYELLRQHWWGDLIAIYLFLGGLGGMTMLVSYYHWLKGAPTRSVLSEGIGGIIAVLIGIGCLVLDLGHPERAYYILMVPGLNPFAAVLLVVGVIALLVSYYYHTHKASRETVVGCLIGGVVSLAAGVMVHATGLGMAGLYPTLMTNMTSFIFVGTILLIMFIIFSILFVAPIIAKRWRVLRWLRTITKFWEEKRPLEVIGLIATLLGIGVALYTGILIGVVESVPFWHTPALPILFLVSAFSTSLSFYCVLLTPQIPLVGWKDKEKLVRLVHQVAYADGVTMIFELIVLGTYALISSYGPPAAMNSVELLIQGDLAPAFLGGVVLIGLVVPILGIFLYELRGPYSGKKALTAFILSLLVLIGGLLLRYVVLSAGVLQVPLV